MTLLGNDDGDHGKDPMRWIGHWWLPNSPDEKLPGVLAPQSEGRGPSLEVAGSFHASGDKKHEVLDIVHGTTPIAEFVTLHNLSEAGSTYDARGQSRTCYDVELAVTGDYFSSVDKLLFQHLRIQYSTLLHWIDQPVFDEEQLKEAGEGRLVFTTRPPVEKLMHQGDGYRLSLRYIPCLETTGIRLTLRMYPGAEVQLRWDAPRPIADILPVVRSVRDFLNLGTPYRL